MQSFYIFLISLLFSPTSAFDSFDFVEDALKKYVNHSADPCDDFYRHACPLGLPFDNLVNYEYGNLTEYLLSLQKDAFWNYYSFKETDLMMYNYSETAEKVSDFLKGAALEICVKKRDSLPWFFEMNKISNISLVSANCANLIEVLNNNPQFSGNSKTLTSDYGLFMYYLLDESIKELEAINGMIDEDVSEGIERTYLLIQNMASIAKEWIKKTPWAANYNVTDAISKTASSYVLLDDLAGNFVAVSKKLAKFDRVYKKCTEEFHDIRHSNLTCQISALSIIVDRFLPVFDFRFNAGNRNSYLMFSYPVYHYQQHGREMAAKLGTAGFVTGHELAHSLIRKNTNTALQRLFSIKAEECIKNQYQSTCDEFKEESCHAYDVQLGDNGADILGLQLAYKVLQQHYGTKLTDKIDRLGVTNEQLFFYAAAFTFCSGPPQKQSIDSNGRPDPHSAKNIRINVMAQHPGFQKAFNCCRDSRMMRSATEQCLIYEERAPQTRKTAGTDHL